MAKVHNHEQYIGKTFNFLTITGIHPERDSNGSVCVIALCKCGKEVRSRIRRIISGSSKSCGCINGVYHKNTVHGLSKHPLYRIYLNIIERCYDKENPHYKYYGARGIEVCEEWRNDIHSFFNWAIANGWEQGLEVDRRDNDLDLGYSPSNCRVVTGLVNKRNRGITVKLTYKGETKALGEWVEIMNIPYCTLHSRYRRGWEHSRIIETPIRYDSRYQS